MKKVGMPRKGKFLASPKLSLPLPQTTLRYNTPHSAKPLEPLTQTELETAITLIREGVVGANDANG